MNYSIEDFPIIPRNKIKQKVSHFEQLLKSMIISLDIMDWIK